MLTHLICDKAHLQTMYCVTFSSVETYMNVCAIFRSQIKVLSEPPPKQAPTLMMPPGLLDAKGAAGQGLPSALMQLASAVMSKEGCCPFLFLFILIKFIKKSHCFFFLVNSTKIHTSNLHIFAFILI